MVSITLCPAVHILGSQNVYGRAEGIADHYCPWAVFLRPSGASWGPLSLPKAFLRLSVPPEARIIEVKYHVSLAVIWQRSHPCKGERGPQRGLSRCWKGFGKSWVLERAGRAMERVRRTSDKTGRTSVAAGRDSGKTDIKTEISKFEQVGKTS